MHGSLIILSENETLKDRNETVRSCLFNSEEFFFRDFDYVEAFDSTKEKKKAIDTFLEEAKRYATVDGNRMTFTLQSVADSLFSNPGFPETKDDTFATFCEYKKWMATRNVFVSPVVIIAENGTLYPGYTLLDVLLDYYAHDSLKEEKLPEEDRTFTFYVVDAFDFHF